MAQVAKRIIPGSQLTATAATYYTAPANTKCVVKRLTFTNTDTVPRAITIHLVPSAGSAADANTITKTKTLYPAETWSCPDAEGHVLEAGGTVQALADSATAVTIIGSGVEIV
jgi:hypothetical protein